MNISEKIAEKARAPLQNKGADRRWVIPSLIQKSMFWRPTYLGKSAWIEHVPFAFWLIEALRPKSFVELGTHYGTSYFAFCQAVERLGLAASCYAVDTWKGDEHAGFYGNEVFEQVEAHNEGQYPGFSCLVRSTFDEALGHFQDGSVDLLHIDGLHTVDAIAHDFESWLPKMSDCGVIVMHDTNVRERGFGVFRFFDSIRRDYPYFEFVHGHGLGVVSVGSRRAALLQKLLQSQSSDTARRAIQETFSRLGQACGYALSLANQKERLKIVSEELGTHSKQLEEARHALETARTDLAARVRAGGELRKRHQNLIEKSAMERGQFDERVRLLEEIRNDQKQEMMRLRNAAGHSLQEPEARDAALCSTEAGPGKKAKLEALIQENHELNQRLRERFSELAVLTKMVEEAEAALYEKNQSSAVAEAKLRADCNRQLSASRIELEVVRQSVEASQQRVQDLLNSHSWKVTSPLRVLMNLIRASFRR